MQKEKNLYLHERICKICGDKSFVDRKAAISRQCWSCYKNGKKKHGMHKSKIYKSWFAMKDRCLNQNNPSYKNYGARGIKVIEKWLNFENFYRDVGEKPEGCSLDRIDNNGDYTPENTRWATKKIQESNTRRNVYITAFGRAKTITQWAEEFGITHKVISKRIKLGWTPERAVSLPVMKQFSRLK